MEVLKSFQEMVVALRGRGLRQRIVAVCPHDECTEQVVRRALSEGIAHFVLVAEAAHTDVPKKIQADFPDAVEFMEAPTPDEAAALAVKVIKEGKGDVLMKGLINTDNLLRAVLKKEIGLLPPGGVLTHVSVAETPLYHKLLCFSDAAVIPRPELHHFRAMVKGNVALCHNLGIEEPRVALIHCTEKVNEKFPHTLDYVQLKKDVEEGMFGKAVVDGPMDAKTACDLHSGQVKGIASPVVGNADILIFPNIESGNVFYKTLSFFGKADMAGMLMGAEAPVVVPSRSDSETSKYNSLILACLSTKK